MVVTFDMFGTLAVATSAAGEPALAAFRDRGHSIVVLSIGPLAWLK